MSRAFLRAVILCVPAVVFAAGSMADTGGSAAGETVLARFSGGSVDVEDASREEWFWYGPMTPTLPDLPSFFWPPYPWTSAPEAYVRIIVSRPHYLKAGEASGLASSDSFQVPFRRAKYELIERTYTLHRMDEAEAGEAREYYEKHRDSFKVPETYYFRNVFVQFEGDGPEERARAHERIEQARQALEAGEEFEEVEREFSTRSPEELGQLYRYRKGSPANPQAARALQTMAPGEVSGIIEVRHGYMILRLEQFQSGEPIPYERVKRLCCSRVAKAEIAEDIKRAWKERNIRIEEEGVSAGRTNQDAVVARGDGFVLTAEAVPALAEIPEASLEAARGYLRRRVAAAVNRALVREMAEEAGILKEPEFVRTLEDYRRHVLAALELVRQVSDYLEKEKVTEADLLSEYAEHPERYMGTEGAEVRVLSVPSNHDEFSAPDEIHFARERARRKCAEIRERISRGESFADLAREYPAGGPAGDGAPVRVSDLGREGREIEVAARDLAVGEVSKPIQYEGGYYLVKLEGRQEARPRAFDSVKEEVRSYYLEDRGRAIMNRLLDGVCRGLGVKMN